MFQRAMKPNEVAKHVKVIETASELARIKSPDCAGLIWPCPDLTPVTSWLEQLPTTFLPAGRVEVNLSRLGFELNAMLDAADTPDCDERDALVNAITEMATAFADVMGVIALRLRVDVVTGNACRKFHMDALTARLICTLRGPGTELTVAQQGAEEEGPITMVAAGDALVLRGSNWPTTPASLLRHRSPPIEGSGLTRLVVVLDPLTS